jgi:low affinity Fe/Cu permease
MSSTRPSKTTSILEQLAYRVTTWTGSSWAFALALGLTIVWLITGPIAHFSDTWQLIMNTLSSVVTFLMVFLFQRSQNKDTLAMQVKLNELIAAMKGANNRMIAIEDLSEDEVRRLHDRYLKLAHQVESKRKFTECVSIDAPPRAGARNRTSNGEEAGVAPTS